MQALFLSAIQRKTIFAIAQMSSPALSLLTLGFIWGGLIAPAKSDDLAPPPDPALSVVQHSVPNGVR
ncbi:hypothetical protein ACQ4M3_40180 [Leptolyngbya sp. AN03gr2]|uniref:hypothetical protein n=1 Tax=unclassified Leptolyngbya TaxID=2650499 RepID=UPI003D31D274